LARYSKHGIRRMKTEAIKKFFIGMALAATLALPPMNNFG
jgi:hypothetical protein